MYRNSDLTKTICESKSIKNEERQDVKLTYNLTIDDIME